MHAAMFLIKIKTKIFHTNIRSINKNFDNLLLTLNQYIGVFDIIVLTETWIVYNLNNFTINGYDILYNNSKLNQNDGVIVYVKSELNYSYDIVKIGPLINAIQIKIDNDETTVYITALYRLHMIKIEQFIIDLRSYLKSNSYKEHIFLGDINININEFDGNVSEYLYVLSNFGFVRAINSNTRIQHGNNESCFDHIFLKSSICNKDETSFVLLTQITDHLPNGIILPLNIKNLKRENKKFIEYIGYNKLIKLLNNEKWEKIIGTENPDNQINYFITTVNNAIQDVTTIRKSLNKFKPRKPWINEVLINEINFRDYLFKECRKFPNNTDLYNKYKKFRNNLILKIRKAKILYYKNMLSNTKNPRKTWNIVKEIAGDVKKSIKYPNHIKIPHNNKVVSNDSEIAEEFNKYFASVGPSLAKNIPQNTLKITTNYYTKSMYLEEVNPEEINNYISSLDANKTTGPDNISSKCLKNINYLVCDILCLIINNCFDKGICPNAFKKADIVPLYKNGDRKIVNNYRPISITSALAKIFEKCLHTRIHSFLHSINFFSSSQYGFRTGKSTEDAL